MFFAEDDSMILIFETKEQFQHFLDMVGGIRTAMFDCVADYLLKGICAYIRIKEGKIYAYGKLESCQKYFKTLFADYAKIYYKDFM